ncbi:MAG: heavy-metal-associated domain-containing protein [Marinilabiliaceae bacterium]|nr:heavy-metal-associated domain-containing protein [Marinilabiliaceae bacterium]
MRKVLVLFALSFVILSCQSGMKSENQTVSGKVITKELQLKVDGMTCDGCEMTIKKGLEKLDGIIEVKADHESGTAIITVDTTKIDRSKVVASIEELGYRAR